MQIWNRVYEELVEPCVRMIHAGKDEEAYRLYQAYTMEPGEKYLLPS